MEHSTNEVGELPANHRRLRNDLIQPLHRLDILLAVLGCRSVWVIKFTVFEKFAFGTRGLVGDVGRHFSLHDLHHCQVFEIIVRLEKGFTGEEFDEDATDRVHVTWVRPAQTEDDFRSSVVSSTDDRRVEFALKGCASKIDQANLGVPEDVLLFGTGSLQTKKDVNFLIARCGTM